MKTQNTPATYWRSLEELADGTALPAELAKHLSPEIWSTLTATNRRQFLKVLGASLALAGMAGCRWPKEEILPFSNRPPGRAPGVPARYATAFEIGGSATALLVTSYDGRPIKVEGNPDHPSSMGSCDRFAQASLLELYDPDRSRSPQKRLAGQSSKQSWEEFSTFAQTHFAALKRNQGKGLFVLSEASSSPSLLRMKKRLLSDLPGARWFSYEPLSHDNERAGTALAFGRPYRPQFRLARAEVIVTLDADLLLGHPAALANARQFAGTRTGSDGTMSRLYAFESSYTVTGAAADHRITVPSGVLSLVLAKLAAQLFLHQRLRPPLAAGHLGEALVKVVNTPLAPSVLPALATHLRQATGRSLIAVGPNQPAEVHAFTCLLNQALGNVGRTIVYTRDPEAERPSHMDSLQALTKAIEAGQVETLVILGGNPVFNSPADLDFSRALEKVGTTIHLSLHEDETSRVCSWHLPRAHYLESWGDARAYDGTISIVQPLIAPLFEGKSSLELLALILGDEPKTGHEIVQQTFQETIGGRDFQGMWRKSLHDGWVTGSAFPSGQPRANWRAARDLLLKLAAAKQPDTDDLEITFCQDHSIYDGRFANNAWLQELPDPLTKLTWDNAALLSPATAESLGVEHGSLVKLHYRGRELEIAAYVMPGQADNSVAVALGYGRQAAGAVGNRTGFNAYMLRTTKAPGFDLGLRLVATGRSFELACTQQHHQIDAVGSDSRHKRLDLIVREGDLAEFKQDPRFAHHRAHLPRLKSLWQEHSWQGHRWGMTIDLTACIGCNACVVACQAENNIPVVGKENVSTGREMHWIRLDRYFSGPPTSPSVSFQPVACQQCENAPCEEVCPVAATQHSEEGLNEMVYNRCVGTRYCANNCPYKVRRFNFFNYHKNMDEVEKMTFNPEVTVRSRGVMEKCSYCVQRINRVKIDARNQQRHIRDGEITPACAQTCPTGAIVFGDLADSESRVAKLHQHPRAYAMLGELNVRPRTHYLARLRNRGRDWEDEG